MSINAADMRRLSADTEYRINGKSYSDLLEEQNRGIRKAALDGRTQCIFYISDTIYDEWEPRMREHYLKKGFTFKPIGINGGVRQVGDYICW